ncbi:hypothetical protein [Mesonia sp. K4-1]|uniref:hypothetical protein n=1 Tax=Mesonia sp. K4-1 TaxID=2602760 RepID=UPI0011C9A03E|nr:hypothetical protein [Mesonia sp. K4-1]TXK78677.1 hypothetical protein FT986_02470 [Mesonia sp. K4-1]
MRNIIVIKILILSICFSSCRSKKISTEVKETVKIDTVYQEKRVFDTIIITKEKEITKPVYFETIMDCDDEQSGKVGTGNNYTQYHIQDGKIYLKTNLDSISNSYESYYRTKFVNDSINLKKLFRSKESKETEIVKYVYPWWIWLLGAGLILFFGLWVYQNLYSLI